MDVLLKLRRESDILKRLGKLPKTLKLAYDEIYEKIQLQMESAPTIANRAFQWVMCSRVPLSPAKLVAAVCQGPDIVKTSKVDVDIDFVIEACQNLLTVDHEQEYCRFSHLSVQEYFEDHRWNSSEANALVGKVCLSLLNYNLAPQERAVRILIEKGKNGNIEDLFRYASYYWPDHVQQHGEENVDSRLAALLKQFLGSMNKSSLAYQNWHKMISIDVNSTGFGIFHQNNVQILMNTSGLDHLLLPPGQ